MPWSRPLRLLAACVMLAIAHPALSAPFAAIVIDARDGTVLHAENADTRLHPASLTKMMTLYLAFEAVTEGRLSLDQRVTISRNAAREPPSKIGLKPGQRVTIRHLIRAAAIKSANDAATALGEAIAGSEDAFATMMTAKARALGMTRTRFRNAHGLTRNGHLSSARDMAILARHLFFDYPQYYNLFGRVKTPAMGRTLYNTNRLLRSYDGADGIKTGYTRAAGFNLAASAERGTERIIVVVFGGRNSRQRNAKVAELLDLGFRKAPTHAREVPPGLRLDPSVKVASAPPPRGTPPASLIARSVEVVADAVATPAAASTRDGPLVTATAVPASRRPPPRPQTVPGDWTVQLGAYKEREYALRALRKAMGSDLPALRGTRTEIDATVIRGLPLFQALVIGLSEDAAQATCAQLRDQRLPCRPRPVDAGG